MTSLFEYFAETTEAYFSRNDFFPFTRDELKRADPDFCALLGTVWGVATNQLSDGRPRSPSSASSPSPGSTKQ